MEIRNSKQQQLTFEKGITNVPSDAICSDNTLEESMGMVYDDGEHRVIQKPKEKTTLENGHTLLYIHKYNGDPRYITKYQNTLYWHDSTPVSLGVTNPLAVTAVGNTLVVNTTTGLNYLLWDGTQYKSIGTDIPEIPITFSLDDFDNDFSDSADKFFQFPGDVLDGLFVHRDGNNITTGSVVANGKYEDFKTTLIGVVSSRLNEIKEKNLFAFPFWARYAIRLYDGTYTHISQPFLLMPTVRNNWDIFTCSIDAPYGPIHMDDSGGLETVNYWPWYAALKYQVGTHASLTDWQDIIAGVDIFVSGEVKTFGLEDKWTIENCYNSPTTDIDVYHTAVNQYFDGEHFYRDSCIPEYDGDLIPAVDPNNRWTWNTRFRPSLYSDEEIIDRLVDASVFYKIFELDFVELDLDNPNNQGVKPAGDKMAVNTLKNLKTQTQLPNDDYFSRAPMKANIIKTYNSRLHLADVKRGFFEGFNTFSYTAHNGTVEDYDYYVTIKASDGTRIVKATKEDSLEIPDIWFYYPDPRAKQVDIFRNGTKIASMLMKEHPHLNGAYSFIRLPEGTENLPTLAGSPPTPNSEYELFEDHVFVSEADNPWVFNAKGDVTTNMGAIVGMATQTMSLGEQEHGIHPLTIFSERGISIFRLNNEGVYMRSDEINREVANKDNPCITETDGPVYFASERGLMVLLGSQVKCVSEQLNGKSDVPFATFLKNAFIAYDYRDSLLWIFDGATHTVDNTQITGSRYCYIYSIKSGTFARYDFGSNSIISNVVADYPDYLLQSGQNIYSLMGRDNINADNRTYTGQIITRPMKLENAFALKKLIQVRHVSQMKGSMTLRIFASNNLNHWGELHSLLGTPWKYYKFRYDFENLKATDRFAGSVIITQESRGNKLR